MPLAKIDTDIIPEYAPETATPINDFVISDEKILKIIRSLNPNKALGWDEISVRMIKLSDAALITPLKMIFTNCLRRRVFQKYGNVQTLFLFIRKTRKI